MTLEATLMVPSLSNLPIELIVKVIDLGSFTEGELLELALANKAFSVLILPRLWKCLEESDCQHPSICSMVKRYPIPEYVQQGMRSIQTFFPREFYYVDEDSMFKQVLQ